VLTTREACRIKIFNTLHVVEDGVALAFLNQTVGRPVPRLT
jgi:hypothetical protein